MHAAPPVRMTLAPDPGWRMFMVACGCAAAANLGAWVASSIQAPPWIVAAAALGAGCLAGGLARLGLARRGAGPGALVWDGAVWHWMPDTAPATVGELRVMVDLGGWILLHFVPGTSPPRPAWLTVSRRQGAGQWPLWRAALFSRRPGVEPTATDRA